MNNVALQVAQQEQNETGMSTKAKIAFGVIFTLIAVLFASQVVAGAGGAQFQSIWTEISTWLDGVPGKIIALLAFGIAMFNVVKQNFMMAIGAFVGALLMANAVEIINGFMSASLPIVL